MKLTETDFESGQDSAILVRERTQGTKLEGAYKKRKGTLLEQSNHTITFLPAGSNKATVISKRDDVGNTNGEGSKPCCSCEATLLEEIRKYSERALPGELINEDEQTYDANRPEEETHTLLPKLTERQTMPEQTRRQEPAMKALEKKVKKMKKN